MKKIKLTKSQINNLMVNEQGLKNIGNKIKTGVQNVVNKVTGKSPDAAAPQDKGGRDMDQLKAEWSKINQDMSNMRGYGEAVGQTESSAHTAAMMKAKAAILKKLNKSYATFGADIVDEATFRLENGNYFKMVILELRKVWEDDKTQLWKNDGGSQINEEVERIKSIILSGKR